MYAVLVWAAVIVITLICAGPIGWAVLFALAVCASVSLANPNS